MKKKIVCSFILILGVLSVIIGITLNLKKPETKQKQVKNNNIESGPILKTKEEVINQLKKGGVTATYIGEENKCWKFQGDNSVTYTYCLSDGTLKGIKTP